MHYAFFYFNQIQPVKQNILVTLTLLATKRFAINMNIESATTKLPERSENC